MLTSILAQCLEPHKRLVVPGLGAFIVKKPGRCVVFTELLKRDDGILRQTLLDRGVDESEIAGLIDRFVSDVHHAVGAGNEVCVPGLGTLRSGANGTIAFVFDPGSGSEQSGEENAAPVEPVSKEPYSAPVAEPVAAPSTTASGVKEPTNRTAAPKQEGSGRLARTLRAAYEEPPVSTSVRMSPDPAVKGLRYSQPLKTTDAYTYVGDSSHRHHHHHRRHHHRRQSRGWVVWGLALLAILIAVGTLGYHFLLRPWLEQRELDKFLKQNGLTTSVIQPEPAVSDGVVSLEPEYMEP